MRRLAALFEFVSISSASTSRLTVCAVTAVVVMCADGCAEDPESGGVCDGCCPGNLKVSRICARMRRHAAAVPEGGRAP